MSDLPTRLSTDGSPAGAAALTGDITYYSPWGNLAIFYRDFGYAPGLVTLGRFDFSIEQLVALSGELPVTFDVLP